MRNLIIWIALSINLTFAQKAGDLTSSEWTRPFPPFRIAGNLYYVGTWDLGCYLITTPAGHILINSGLADSVPQIQSNVETLGFKFPDVKIITVTHGHWDHAAGVARLKSLTGAKVAAAEAEAPLLESGGRTDFRWGQDQGAWFEPVKVDMRVKDGGKIVLGGTELTVHVHPGHTKGAASFTFQVKDDSRTWRVLLVNMGSINPGVHLAGQPSYPGIAADYAATFQDQKTQQFDIWVASHASQFRLHDKHRPGDPYSPEKFADPQGYRAEVDRLERVYRNQLAREGGGK